MKVKEKKELLRLLEAGDIEGSKNFVLSCTKDHYNNKATAAERNKKWAEQNQKFIDLLDMKIGDSKLVNVKEYPKGTTSCIRAYAFPDRKYKLLSVDAMAYIVARVK